MMEMPTTSPLTTSPFTPSPQKNRPLIVPLVIVTSLLGVILLATLSVVLYQQNRQLKAQLLTLQQKDQPKNNPSLQYKQELANKEWESPSKTKKIWFELRKNSDEYSLQLYDGVRTISIGRGAEPLQDLKVSWSPNEKYVLIATNDDVNRIICTDDAELHCSGNTVFVAYTGLTLAYWPDDQTAYIRYNQADFDVISKLAFADDATSKIPKETILYKEPWNAFFAYRPVSVSPDERYLILEFSYEGPPTLFVMNTRTGSILAINKNDKPYIVGEDPNYTWKGNVVTFNAAWAGEDDRENILDEDRMVKAEAIKSYSVDVSLIK